MRNISAAATSLLAAVTVLVLAARVSTTTPAPAPAPAESVPARAFLVFGDSLVDSGNNNYLMTTARADSPPNGIDYPHQQPTGRFSNGLNFPDLIAEALGLESPLPFLNPDLKGKKLLAGANFASAGIGVLNDTGFQFVRLKFDREAAAGYGVEDVRATGDVPGVQAPAGGADGPGQGPRGGEQRRDPHNLRRERLLQEAPPGALRAGRQEDRGDGNRPTGGYRRGRLHLRQRLLLEDGHDRKAGAIRCAPHVCIRPHPTHEP
ncbi:unnamed protein product [Linum tenue]|uniref:GDSL esterase/lipase n=1 Tax=Linum tenue TaxID=586396 RepID=A0AAV0I9Q3_9ROSI|nr:unnamed protein product [Linum tenue]